MTQPTSISSATRHKQKKGARDLRSESLKIVNSIKTEGQIPVETKAIANGIQRGMEIFLRQQSEKKRDLDKRSKKVKQLANLLSQQKPETDSAHTDETTPQSQLPWVLLALSWALFFAIGIWFSIK